MDMRKKRNMAIAAVLSLLILPLFLLSLKMDQDLAAKLKNKKENTQRRPAVQDASFMMLSE